MNENKGNTVPKGADGGTRDARELREAKVGKDARDGRDGREAKDPAPTGPAATPLKGRWDRDWNREEWVPGKREEAAAPPPTECRTATPTPPAEPDHPAESPSARPMPPPPATPSRPPLAENLQQAAATLTAIALALDALDAMLHRAGSELGSWSGKDGTPSDLWSHLPAAGEWVQNPLELREMLRQYLMR